MPAEALTEDEHEKNNLPDVLRAGRSGTAPSASGRAPRRALPCRRPRSPAPDYDLSINRYKEVVHEAVEHRPPKEIIAELKALEGEIAEGLDELEAML